MQPPSRGVEFVAGVRDQSPLLLGVAPFGFAFGAYAAESGISSAAAMAMSSIIFGGASQFVAARMIAASAPGVVIALAVWLVNLRHLLYSAAIAPRLDHLPVRWRAALAYLLTDEAYLIGARRFEAAGAAPFRHWYVLGTGLALWGCWQVTTAAGVAAGTAVPESWELEFSLPLTFIALVVPALRGRATMLAAAVAAGVAVAGYSWPYSTGLFAAALAGMAAGIAVSRRPGEDGAEPGSTQEVA
jgi:4-azaleucine resistance transporter AzlC